MPTEQEIIEICKECYDPEIPVNIYDLGLIYSISARDQGVDVTMTLTSQGCPSAQQLPEMLRSRVQAATGLQDVKVKVVWDPPWNPSMISPEGRKILHLEEEF